VNLDIMNSDTRLLPVSIVVLAGAVATGLGHVAKDDGYRDNFAIAIGGVTMVVGLFIFLLLLMRPSGGGGNGGT
jgi:hypothetical protein